MPDEEIIRRKNMEHLKLFKGFLPMPEEHKDIGPSESQPQIK